MFFQDNIKNIFLILLVIIIFSGLGFYSAYVIQDEKIAKLTGEKSSTINRLNSEVSYLRNIFGDLLIEYEELEKEMRMYENDYMQKSVEYKDLSEKYAQLDYNYTSLLTEYADLNSSIVLERESLLNKTRVGDNNIKIFFNNVSFECPQEVIVTVNAFVNTNITDMLTGNPCNEKTFITLSCNYSLDEPNLNATLKEAYRSVEKYVNGTGLNNTMIKDDYKIRYTNFSAILYGEQRYVLVSTWYNANTSHQYLCVVQQEESTVVATFSEMMASFRQY